MYIHKTNQVCRGQNQEVRCLDHRPQGHYHPSCHSHLRFYPMLKCHCPHLLQGRLALPMRAQVLNGHFSSHPILQRNTEKLRTNVPLVFTAP